MISIPILNVSSSKEKRPEYLRLFREAGAGRVFLFVGNPFGDPAELDAALSLLSENIAWYTANGLEAAVWIGGFGHGGPALSPEIRERARDFTMIRDLASGADAADSFCPLDPGYRRMFRDFVRRIAEHGARMIMIDDDLRLSLHGTVTLGCACPRHLAEFNRRASRAGAGIPGHEYTREELAGELFTGKPTPLRRIWLELMGDTMRGFARELREELDAVDPAIRLGHCACLPTWDTDGTDSIELARIFAGKRARPFLRLIGAPYWNNASFFHTTGPGSLVDLERMQFAWCRAAAPEIELMSEGDVFPRPRCVTPSSYLETFHQALTAVGEEDILKYIYEYTDDLAYEPGYHRRHVLAAPRRGRIAEAFRGSVSAGILIWTEMHTIADMDCTGYTAKDLASRLIPAAVNFANALSLPVSFDLSPRTHAVMIAGESAKTVPASLADGPLPLVLDCQAARILTGRGFDAGLEAFAPLTGERRPDREIFSDGRSFPVDCGGRFYSLTLKAGAEADSRFPDGSPAVYRYSRENGAPVIVYAFDFDTVSMQSAAVLSYSRQEQLFRLLPGIPARIEKEPGAYVLCRGTGTDGRDGLAVGVWNFGRDTVCPGEILLDGRYASLRMIDSDGVSLRLSPEGDRILVNGALLPFGFVGCVLEK